MSEKKALVAKSYEGLEQICPPYTMNGREYVKVRMKNGQIKQVRAYSEAEYRKYNPEVIIVKPAKSRRDVLGFGEQGFIWLFKGETFENLDWFHDSPCRYARTWGWYLPSNVEMPDPLPANITPVKLEWDEVSFEDRLISEDQIKAVADAKLFDPSPSKHVGKVGDRLDLMLTCDKAVQSQSIYGISTFHVFHDQHDNIFTWSTTSKCLEEGETYHIKGTVKGHDTYRNTAQTALTRCSIC